ncbi:hypothetical protein Q604_UNBC00132G0001, partial [human gut metagenome]
CRGVSVNDRLGSRRATLSDFVKVRA